MEDHNGGNKKAADRLRRDAEALLRAKPDQQHPLSPPKGDARRALHELEVYRIELEMQNAELVRSRAETEASLQRYTDLYDFAPVGYLTLAPDGVITAVNLGGAGILGVDRSRLLGRRFVSFIVREGRPAFEEFLRKAFLLGTRTSCEVSLRTDAHLPFYAQIEALAAAPGAECRIALIDITERKLLESRLSKAQKLESLGILAGGIAHDFNNLLMAIFGNVDLALLHLDRESPAAGHLHRIQLAATRAADLTKQMLAYSGKGRLHVENLDLNVLIEELLQMLKISISRNVSVKLELQRPLPTVQADSSQMHQIIMNLVINASEAMEEQGGSITITTGALECDSDYLNEEGLNQQLGEGRYVYLDVADTGCGMSGETMAKLYDPFFTTKFAGRGLGMAAVQGIVRGHKGTIKVESVQGIGTTFRVLLPASDLPAEVSHQDETIGDWKGSGTVLLVDDEEEVRSIGAELLRVLGFTPITANDGQEALSIYREAADITLVILDSTMPVMDGNQCCTELHRLNPDVKVIVSSGYSEHEVARKFADKGVSGFIHKPYTLAALRDVIRAVC